MIQGRFQPVLAAGRYNPVLAKLARFGANRSQVGTNPLKKKKTSNVTPTRKQQRRSLVTVLGHVGRRWGTYLAASVHHSAYLLHVYKEKSTGKTATKFHLSLILLEALNTKY